MKEISKKVYKIFAENPLAWGMYYFEHHFRLKSPNFHYKILIESIKHRYFAAVAPRGAAKSTVLTFLKPIHYISFKKKRFIVIVQNTYKKAIMSLETIKNEIKENQKLRKDFPIEIRKDSEGDSIFRHKDGFEIRVLCKGAEQIGSVRGEKFGAYRPDYILIDDLEDDIMVRNPENRVNLKDLYDKALIKAGDVNTEVDAIGTILHDDSLIAKLVDPNEYKAYRKLFYRARYENTVTGETCSLWPEKWSVEELNQMERDDPTTFAQEMQNDPVSGMKIFFEKEDFRRWYIEEGCYILYDDQNKIISKGEMRNCKPAIACDLAWDEKRRSDGTAVVPAYLTPNSELLIEKYFYEKGVKPDQLEEILFTMAERMEAVTGKPVPIGFEKGKMEKMAKWNLKQAMKRRNKFLMTKDLDWDADKISRIVTRLQPRYKQNVIFHKTGMGELEHQLLRIPSGKHDDLPDAVQGLVQLLQYAPEIKKEEKKSEDPGFDWLRKRVVGAKPKKSTYIFGKKANNFNIIPSKETWG